MSAQKRQALLDTVTVLGEGNYLGKSRRNFFLSGQCWQLIHEMSLQTGLNHSGVIELVVRFGYHQMVGNVPLIPMRRKRDE